MGMLEQFRISAKILIKDKPYIFKNLYFHMILKAQSGIPCQVIS